MKQNEERQHEIENLRSFLEDTTEYIIKNYCDYESSIENITEYIIENYNDYRNFLKNKRKPYYKEAYKKVTNYLHSLGFSNALIGFDYLRDVILLYYSYESYRELILDIAKKYGTQYNIVENRMIYAINISLPKVDYYTKKHILGNRYSRHISKVKFIEASIKILNLRRIHITETINDISDIILNDPHKVMEKISEYLTMLNIPKEMKGYTYLKEVIFIYLSSNSKIMQISKEIYPVIAKKHQTTSNAVERSIRYSVEIVCSKADINILYGLFGNIITHDKGKATNHAFICAIADYVKLEFY